MSVGVGTEQLPCERPWGERLVPAIRYPLCLTAEAGVGAERFVEVCIVFD